MQTRFKLRAKAMRHGTLAMVLAMEDG